MQKDIIITLIYTTLQSAATSISASLQTAREQSFSKRYHIILYYMRLHICWIWYIKGWSVKKSLFCKDIIKNQNAWILIVALFLPKVSDISMKKLGLILGKLEKLCFKKTDAIIFSGNFQDFFFWKVMIEIGLVSHQ